MSLKHIAPQQHRRVRVILIEATGPHTPARPFPPTSLRFLLVLIFGCPFDSFIISWFSLVHLIQNTSCHFFLLVLHFFLGDFLDLARWGLSFPLALLAVRRIKPPLFSSDRLPARVGRFIWKELFIFFRAATDTINGYGSTFAAEEPKRRKCPLHPSFRARRQSSGTVPTLPPSTLSSKFTGPQQGPLVVSARAPNSDQLISTFSTPNCPQGWSSHTSPGRQPLLNYLIPLLSNHLERC